MKIKDLKDPTKKMSKSEENPGGVISMFDSAEVIKKKISLMLILLLYIELI